MLLLTLIFFFFRNEQYFEYDGKQFGYGTTSIEIPDFQGARKITSLPCHPLRYHKNEARLRESLIERGKKFVQLSGVNYKSHQGMAFFKKKKAVVKVNINGRVMVDPAIFRRINPNYQISVVKPKDHNAGSESEDSDEGGCGGGDSDSSSDDRAPKYVTKIVKDSSGKLRPVKVLKEENVNGAVEKLDDVVSKDGEGDEKGGAEGGGSGGGGSEDEGEDKVKDKDGEKDGEKEEEAPARVFSEEEYLISSPVVLGFAFSEKLWLELTVSGIREIQWNDGAYESLVLEPKTKDIVKVSLVVSSRGWAGGRGGSRGGLCSMGMGTVELTLTLV